MSQKSFSAFRAKLADDEALREELSRALTAKGTAEDMVAFARQRGYDFSADEVKTSLELSDEELESVAGGVTVELLVATIELTPAPPAPVPTRPGFAGKHIGKEPY